MKKSVYDGSDFVRAQRLNLIVAVLEVLSAVIVYHVVRGDARTLLLALIAMKVVFSLTAAGFIGRGLGRLRDQVKVTILRDHTKTPRRPLV